MTTMCANTFRSIFRIPSSAKASTSSVLLPNVVYQNRASSSSSTSSSPPPTQSAASLLTSHLDQSTLKGPLSNSKKSKTLYEHLVSLPNNGVGTRVRQIRWAARGIDIPWNQDFKGPIIDILQRKDNDHLCYWEVTKARIKWTGENKAPHGKVWGRLVWRGSNITEQDKEERIKGGLKYSWDAAK